MKKHALIFCLTGVSFLVLGANANNANQSETQKQTPQFQAAQLQPPQLEIPQLQASRAISATEISVPEKNLDLKGPTKNLNPKVLKLAMSAYECAELSGVSHSKLLTIIDYSLPSTTQRMWVIDTASNKVLYNTAVAHGKGSGDVKATHFSNVPSSHASSLGLYLTGEVYQGHNGYSLRLQGLDKGFNDNALSRAVVMHGANYVSPEGHVGRSWGCPALPREVAKPIIKTIKDQSLIFAYYPEKSWLNKSKYLNCPAKIMAKNDKYSDFKNL